MTIEDGMPRVDATPEDAARHVKETAETLKHTVASTVSDAAQKQSAQASVGFSALADALTRAASELGSENAFFASCLTKTAQGVKSTAAALDGGDVEGGMSAAADFARRQPAVFLGASFAAGFALARVGKTALETVDADASSVKGRAP